MSEEPIHARIGGGAVYEHVRAACNEYPQTDTEYDASGHIEAELTQIQKGQIVNGDDERLSIRLFELASRDVPITIVMNRLDRTDTEIDELLGEQPDVLSARLAAIDDD